MSINVGDGVVKLIADPSGVDRELAQMGRKGTKAGKQVTAGLKPVSASLSNIKKLALGVGGVFVAWQVFRVLRDAAKAALAFGKEMANVATLINTQTPKGVKQLKILKQQILALRPELGSARELTQGLYQALSAGVEPAGAVKLVGEAALFAKAALTDTLTAVDIITTSINAYGLSAEDAASVSSVLFKTIEEGKITGQELAASLGRVIPTAAALNVSLPELNAALATMTKSGLSTAEAVTSLRAILKTLTSPEASKRFEALGISQAKMRDIITKQGLNAALQELGKRLKGSTTATTNLFRETEAQVGVFTLLGAGAEEYKRALGVLVKAQKDATATAIAAEKVFATLDARLEAISVTMQKEYIAAFGKATPAINAALTSMQQMATEGSALGWVLDKLAWLLTLSVEAWLLFKATVEKVGEAIFSISADISKLAEKIPFVNGALRALGITTERLTEIQENFGESAKKSFDAAVDLEIAWKQTRKEMEKLAEKAAPAADGIDKIGAAAGRATVKVDALLDVMARLSEENRKLIEPLGEWALQKQVDDLNEALGDVAYNLELAAEDIGVFIEPTEEQLAALGEAVKENTMNFVGLGQQAVAAFNQMAGAAQGAGGVMLRIMAMVASQILNEIALRQTEVAATAAAEVGKAGVTLKALKQLALVQAVIQTGKAFAALAEFNFWKAAQHFAAAALFGSVGAMQVMAIVGAIGGRRGAGAGAPGAGAEGAAPVRGQVAGDTSGGGTLEVERRLQGGGIITRPTLALLGEQAPRIPEAVIPLRRNRAGGIELDEGGGVGGGVTIIVQGSVVSADTLLELMEQMSELVRSNGALLESSTSLEVVSRS